MFDIKKRWRKSLYKSLYKYYLNNKEDDKKENEIIQNEQK